MKLDATIQIEVSQTDALFQDAEEHAVRVEVSNSEITPLDSFVEVIEEGARNLGMTPEEIIKRLGVVRVSMPAVVETIVAKRLGTVMGVIVTDKEETTVFHKNAGPNPLFDFLVSPEMVVSVKEEVSQDGQLVLGPDREVIRDRVRYLLEHGAGALVVSFKNSHLNPINEKTVKELIQSDYPRHYLGAVPVFISSDFGSGQDDFTRTHHCLLNVYCWAGVDDTISRMESYLRDRKFMGSFLISNANGSAVPRAGLVPLDTSRSIASLR
ncbi:MAG: hydantoinase/oxoprolinase N-terminal domain-containing protein [Deltaproteobacteria bacterium]